MTARAERALLAAAIKRSGLSARRFARDVMIRDERTVRRWLKGDRPIPDVVLCWLEAYLKQVTT